MLMGSMLMAAVLAAAPVSPNPPHESATVMEVLKPQGESLLKAGAWQPAGEGFSQEAGAFVCDNGAAEKAIRGAAQTVVLNQKIAAPIVAEAWSKAEAVGGEADGDYSLYLDLLYTDGTPLWGQIATFRTGTYDWQRVEVRIFPAKPVKSVTVNLLLRRHSGKAYFKDARLVAADPRLGAALFDGLPVRWCASPVGPGFIVRDVAADSNYNRPDLRPTTRTSC